VPVATTTCEALRCAGGARGDALGRRAAGDEAEAGGERRTSYVEAEGCRFGDRRARATNVSTPASSSSTDVDQATARTWSLIAQWMPSHGRTTAPDASHATAPSAMQSLVAASPWRSFFGTHPQAAHVPRNGLQEFSQKGVGSTLSTSAIRAPCADAALMAKEIPADPPPTTTASKVDSRARGSSAAVAATEGSTRGASPVSDAAGAHAIIKGGDADRRGQGLSGTRRRKCRGAEVLSPPEKKM
jgi:hypothetical protein